jgi:hypothetical protein
MSIDITKLENVTHTLKNGTDVIIARCPACAEEDCDNKGNHLIVFPDGRFGCVMNPVENEDSAEHRKRIFALVGAKTPRFTRRGGRYRPKVRMVAVSKLEQIVSLEPKSSSPQNERE